MPLKLTSNPIPSAVQRLAAKTPVVSKLRTAEWAKMPLALRERAQFSAAVENIRVIATIQDKVLKRLSMAREEVARGKYAGVGAESFVADLKRVIRGEGIGIGTGGLTDISSAMRLRLIYNFQKQSANEFARWKIAQDFDARNNFPAREFIRVEDRRVPRNWPARWNAAFAPFDGATNAASGRMVALVNHPGWTSLSRFGTPWPPFDFGSGMGVESVDRADAVRLGLLQPDEVPASAETDFNANLEASLEDIPQEFRDKLTDWFGDQIEFKNDKAVWQGNLIGDLYKNALSDKNFKDRVDFGLATSKASELAKPYFDISNHKFYLSADDVRKSVKSHGEEKRGDQRSLTALDFEVLPHIWREPDSVSQGTKLQKKSGKTDYTLEFSKRMLGKTWVITWQRTPSKVMFLNTLWVEKQMRREGLHVLRPGGVTSETETPALIKKI